MSDDTGPRACPGCTRRYTCKPRDVLIDAWDRGEVATWQCVYCGTISSRSPTGARGDWIAERVAPITMAPGTLEDMRRSRANDR